MHVTFAKQSFIASRYKHRVKIREMSYGTDPLRAMKLQMFEHCSSILNASVPTTDIIDRRVGRTHFEAASQDYIRHKSDGVERGVILRQHYCHMPKIFNPSAARLNITKEVISTYDCFLTSGI